jgi:hypothetical protein
MAIDDPLVNDLSDFIVVLEQPLSSEELKNGWTTDCQTAIAVRLKEILEVIRHNRPFQELGSLGRSLDHWGVTDGPLLERACALSNRLRNYSPRISK